MDRFENRLKSLPLRAPSESFGQPQTLAAIRDGANQQAASLLQKTSRMSWTAKASVLLAVAATGLVLYSALSSSTGTARAFAAVAEALNNVRSATWKSTDEIKGSHQARNSTGIGMFLAPCHERTEDTYASGVKVIQIIDGQKDKVITLSPAKRTATILNYKNRPSEDSFATRFQELREFVARAQNGKIARVERLGDATVDGRPALGFRLQKGPAEIKIWVDPKTLLPIRVEMKRTWPNGPDVRSVMSDFQFDVSLDSALFSTDIPEGYTLEQSTDIDLSKKPIEYLADTLKVAAEANDGTFPTALREEELYGIIHRAEEIFAQKHSDAESSKFSLDIGMDYSSAFDFLYKLSPEENDWHYAGKDVKLNTPDRPIFWYRTSKSSTTYQVLYADLSTKEVPADEVRSFSAKESSKP